MQKGGNDKAKAKWEANVPKGTVRPSESDAVAVVERWIRDKYEKKKYMARYNISIIYNLSCYVYIKGK